MFVWDRSVLGSYSLPWDVINGFAFLLQFFSLIFVGLGGVSALQMWDRNSRKTLVYSHVHISLDRAGKLRFFGFWLLVFPMKISVAFLLCRIFFCTMDPFFRIFEKTLSELICTRLYAIWIKKTWRHFILFNKSHEIFQLHSPI